MKQFHTTYLTAQDTCMNGMVFHRLSATTQSHCGTCWVTGALTRCSSYTSEPRVDSRTPTVISRCFRLRLMFFLPTLPFSLPVTWQWRPRHQDTPTALSPPTLCGCSPFPFFVLRCHICTQSLQAPPVTSVGSTVGQTPSSRFGACHLGGRHV